MRSPMGDGALRGRWVPGASVFALRVLRPGVAGGLGPRGTTGELGGTRSALRVAVGWAGDTGGYKRKRGCIMSGGDRGMVDVDTYV